MLIACLRATSVGVSSGPRLSAAVQPGAGRAFALVLPELNAEAMQVFLDRFAATLSADEQAVFQPSYSPKPNLV